MKIIVFLNERKKALRLTGGLWTCAFVLVSVAVLGVVIFNLGGIYMDKRHLEGELQTLEDVKTDTETALNVMVGRLGLLQSHVMRLDALGARLAKMAQLDDMEFGIANPPGIGGPQTMLTDGSQGLSDFDFLISLYQLEQALEDRQDKLSAMEAMLMGRSLQDQARPLGNPAEGGWFSSLFGSRTDPISGKKEYHRGVDLAGRSGMLVTSVASGIVTWSGPNQGYGNLVEISHGNGYVTRYAHNKENLVSAGEKVEKGEVIAIMGNTGRSTGTHVHFEVVRNGLHVNPRSHISLQ
jgi:murein DD-endopeptidase MepM/ murein hydrolase activator NlpD